MNKKDHFNAMEENYLEVTTQVEKLLTQLNEFNLHLDQVDTFTQYYGSKEWFEHVEMDRNGELADSPSTSVLGEDYPYETITELRDAAIKMLEMATHLLK